MTVHLKWISQEAKSNPMGPAEMDCLNGESSDRFCQNQVCASPWIRHCFCDTWWWQYYGVVGIFSLSPSIRKHKAKTFRTHHPSCLGCFFSATRLPSMSSWLTAFWWYAKEVMQSFKSVVQDLSHSGPWKPGLRSNSLDTRILIG